MICFYSKTIAIKKWRTEGMGWRLNGLISKEKMNSCSLNDMKTM